LEDRRTDGHEGVMDVKKGLGVLARCEDGAQASPFVIGGPPENGETVRV
jgi:hypothetical protein